MQKSTKILIYDIMEKHTHIMALKVNNSIYKMHKNLIIFFFSLLLSLPYSQPQQPSLSLTIYNNMAVVKQIRSLSFESGVQSLYFTDVASSLEPETVTFKCLQNAQEIRVQQQNFDNNVVDKQKLLQKYVGAQVWLFVKMGEDAIVYKGKLIGYKDGVGIQMQQEYGNQSSRVMWFNLDAIEGFQFSGIPDGFFIRPTLSWKLFSPSKQTKPCKMAYRTRNLSWQAKYTMTLNPTSTRLDLGSYIQLTNKSGKEYKNTKLKLIAGQVNLIQKKLTFTVLKPLPMKSLKQKQQPKFSYKSFSDYYIYSLNRVINISDNESKSIQLTPTRYNLQIDTTYTINLQAGGSPDPHKKVQKWISFNNSLQNNLGLPLPRGNVELFQINQQDHDIMYIGSNNITNVPKNQNVSVNLGEVGVLGCRVEQVSRETLDNMSGYRAQMILTLTNNNQQQDLSYSIIFNNIYAGNLKLTTSTKYNIISAKKFEWKGTVEKDGKIEIKWQEKYSLAQL